MTTLPATLDCRAEWDAHAACRDDDTIDVASYVVVQTIDGRGRVLDPAKVIAVYDNPPRPFAYTNAYTDALEHARRLRVGKGYAVVASRYACGHSLW
ncbi:MAG: hypothetical protein V4472_25070 [Pseudomonadota bacterium]